MRDDHFEWDDTKAAANWAKHKVSFSEARAAFDDPNGLYLPQDHDTEDRILLIATTTGRILAVAHVERGVRRRIISARRATKHEKDDYFTGAR